MSAVFVVGDQSSSFLPPVSSLLSPLSSPTLPPRDLFGAVTQPLKVSRTIVTGQSFPLVCRLLYLLTYFIRCSEIQPGMATLREELEREQDVMR